MSGWGWGGEVYLFIFSSKAGKEDLRPTACGPSADLHALLFRELQPSLTLDKVPLSIWQHPL